MPLLLGARIGTQNVAPVALPIRNAPFSHDAVRLVIPGAQRAAVAVAVQQNSSSRAPHCGLVLGAIHRSAHVSLPGMQRAQRPSDPGLPRSGELVGVVA